MLSQSMHILIQSIFVTVSYVDYLEPKDRLDLGAKLELPLSWVTSLVEWNGIIIFCKTFAHFIHDSDNKIENTMPA